MAGDVGKCKGRVARACAWRPGARVHPGAHADKMSITTTMLNSGPILEAFGNSGMPRNDDSSRFGKLYKVDPVHTHHDRHPPLTQAFSHDDSFCPPVPWSSPAPIPWYPVLVPGVLPAFRPPHHWVRRSPLLAPPTALIVPRGLCKPLGLYMPTALLSRCEIEPYLLEKSRVSAQQAFAALALSRPLPPHQTSPHPEYTSLFAFGPACRDQHTAWAVALLQIGDRN